MHHWSDAIQMGKAMLVVCQHPGELNSALHSLQHTSVICAISFSVMKFYRHKENTTLIHVYAETHIKLYHTTEEDECRMVVVH